LNRVIGAQRVKVLLFKTYDSALGGRTRFIPHLSCKDPRAPRGAGPRESLETRCLVFFFPGPDARNG